MSTTPAPSRPDAPNSADIDWASLAERRVGARKISKGSLSARAKDIHQLADSGGEIDLDAGRSAVSGFSRSMPSVTHAAALRLALRIKDRALVDELLAKRCHVDSEAMGQMVMSILDPECADILLRAKHVVFFGISDFINDVHRRAVRVGLESAKNAGGVDMDFNRRVAGMITWCHGVVAGNSELRRSMGRSLVVSIVSPLASLIGGLSISGVDYASDGFRPWLLAMTKMPNDGPVLSWREIWSEAITEVAKSGCHRDSFARSRYRFVSGSGIPKTLVEIMAIPGVREGWLAANQDLAERHKLMLGAAKIRLEATGNISAKPREADGSLIGCGEKDWFPALGGGGVVPGRDWGEKYWRDGWQDYFDALLACGSPMAAAMTHDPVGRAALAARMVDPVSMYMFMSRSSGSVLTETLSRCGIDGGWADLNGNTLAHHAALCASDGDAMAVQLFSSLKSTLAHCDLAAVNSAGLTASDILHRAKRLSAETVAEVERLLLPKACGASAHKSKM